MPKKSGGSKTKSSAGSDKKKPAPAKPALKESSKPKPAPKPAPKAPPKAPVKELKAPAKGAPAPTPSKPGAKPDAKAAVAPKIPAVDAKGAKGAKSPVVPAKISAKAPDKGAPKPGKPDGKLGVPMTPGHRYSVMTPDAMSASRAAAAKLAAAAGLHPVKASTNGDSSQRSYTRITKTPFSKKELSEFKEALLAKREQIVSDVRSIESEALTGGSGALSNLPQHMADQGTDTSDQSLAIDIVAEQRKQLKDINAALVRIENGTFGICTEMGKLIGVDRLRQFPWLPLCIEAAHQREGTPWIK